MQLNVLRDPWVPLDRGGSIEHASFVEILAGEKDAADLAHPRDDVRFFARMLLSSLAQVLFPAANAKALRARIAAPMSRAELDARIAPIERDFDLVGTPERAGFLQDLGGKDEDGTEKLFLDLNRHVLFRSLRERDPARSVGVCLGCAVPLLHGVQAFAASGGRGYSPSVRGRPATTTLVGDASLRRSIWANVLHAESMALIPVTLDAPERPWIQERRELAEGERLALVEGLFWPARALRLVPVSSGSCAACGVMGERLGVHGFRAKSKAGAAFFPHPYSPTTVKVKKGKPLTLHMHLRPDRPAWTGLVDVLGAVSEGSEGRAAPVVEQWRDSLDGRACTLLVLDYATAGALSASFVGRLSESFPVSRSHLRNPHFLFALRGLVADAEQAASALRRGLKRAHSCRGARPKKQRDGYWAADAEASFWQATEPAFWRTYRALLDGTLEGAKPFRVELQRVALSLFDRHTRVSIDDPARIDIVVGARRGLRIALAAMVEPQLAAKKKRSRAPVRA